MFKVFWMVSWFVFCHSDSIIRQGAGEIKQGRKRRCRLIPNIKGPHLSPNNIALDPIMANCFTGPSSYSNPKNKLIYDSIKKNDRVVPPDKFMR